MTLFDKFKPVIVDRLKEMGITKDISLFQPPTGDLGDFCFVVNQIAGKKDPIQFATEIESSLSDIDGIDKIVQSTQGNPTRPTVFLNFFIEEQYKLSLQVTLVKESLKQIYSATYGFSEENQGKSVVVEHTSANPISTLHVGNLRNSIQGDTYARILERLGYTVYRHFYVNDVGLQISFVVVGYELIKNQGIKPPIKIDLWLGQVYAIMNCFYNIQKLKNQGVEWDLPIDPGYEFSENDIEHMQTHLDDSINTLYEKLTSRESKDKLTAEDKRAIRELKFERGKLEAIKTDINNYHQTFDDLKERFPDLFSQLFIEVTTFDLQQRVAEYLKHYEKNSDERITALFREVVEWNLHAFRWTLRRYNIEFDQFDYESDLTWSGLPDEIIDQLAESEYAVVHDEAVRYSYPKASIDKFCRDTGIPKKGLAVKGNVPDLQLRRSDGTALYAAKDIAYSVKKFKDRNPEMVFNVIGSEQLLPQFQLLIPLNELGMTTYARGLKHYSYENVDLRGRTMSGRLAQYVTADEFYDETYIRARIAKRAADAERGIDLPSTKQEWQTENETLRAVTLASTRFPLIETAPNKRIELDLDRELDFRRNAGPFVEYAHARCVNLIKKVEHELGLTPGLDVDYTHLALDEIVEVLDHLVQLKESLVKAATQHDPSQVANWNITLAQLFMKFYENYPILRADNTDVAQARLALVEAIRIGLATGLQILGIPAADHL